MCKKDSPYIIRFTFI